jgi:hypothetical protein
MGNLVSLICEEYAQIFQRYYTINLPAFGDFVNQAVPEIIAFHTRTLHTQLEQRRIHVTIATQGWISQKKYLKANGHPLSDVI